jgi:hypothetical protein
VTSTAMKNMTRESVENADTLTFPPPRPPVTITIQGRYGDWPVSIEFTGKPEQIHAAIDRLAACGVVPNVPAAAPAAPQRTKKAKAEPCTYNDAGEACCPLHGRVLRGPNQWGKLYCTAKQDDEYCKYTIAASDA